MAKLAMIYDDEGKYEQADALFTQVVELEKRVEGPEHPATLRTISNMANLYVHWGKYPQAEELFTRTLEIKKRVLGPEHPDAAVTLYSLGEVAAHRGDKDRALALVSQSVDHGLYTYLDLGIEEDPDLASLHGDPRFTALVAHAKQVAEAQQKATATQTSK
jgi:hypothetical protein